MDSVECSGSVKRREDPATGEAGQVIGDIREREGILLGDGVELAVIDRPANLLAVLLGNRN